MNSLLSGAQLLALDPNDIDDSGRIGFFHPDKAAALGRLMAVDGQRDPIKVQKAKAGSDRPWTLVVGKHRTVGARLEGIIIFAIEVSGKPENMADLEASENLHRRPLGPLERAKFTAALVQAAQERIAREQGGLKQHQLAVKARWDRVKRAEMKADQALTDEVNDTCGNLQRVYGWEEAVGEALGMSRDAIYRDLRLFRLIIEPFPALTEQLSRHPVVGENASQLKLIAQVRDQNLRGKVIAMLIADPELSADEARVRVGVDAPDGRAPSQEEKALSAVVGNLGRLSAAQQKQNLPMLVSGLKTAEVKRQLRDLLNKELGDMPEAPAPPKPAVMIRQSVKPDHLVCLDCGEKMERLMPHIREAHGLSMVKYLARWDLPMDYPFTAPNLTMDEDEA